MSSDKFQVTIQGLTPREAISDALFRATTAFDWGKKELWDSAATSDFKFEADNGMNVDKDQLWGWIASKDTTHTYSNIRIMPDPSGDKAIVTCTGLANHLRLGTGLDIKADYFLAGGLNEIHFVKDAGTDGLWRMKWWYLTRKWIQGDQSVLGH